MGGFSVPWGNLNDSSKNWGSAAGDMATQIANGAKNIACTAYRNYPPSLIPNPGDSFLRGFWDSICEDPPPPPSPPFSNGQCCHVTYRVFYKIYAVFNNGNSIYDVDGGGDPVTGTVVGLALDPSSNSQRIAIKCRDCSGNYSYQAGVSFGSPILSWTGSVTRIVQLSHIGENCGDPPPEWNPPPPVFPPGGLDISFTINGGTSHQINLTGIFFGLDIENNLAPRITTNNFNVTFDFGGVNISPPNDNLPPLNEDPESDLPPYPFPRVPTIQPTLPPISFINDAEVNIVGQINATIGGNNNNIQTIIENNTTDIDANLILLDEKISNLVLTFNEQNTDILALLNSLSLSIGELQDEPTSPLSIQFGSCDNQVWTDSTETIVLPTRLHTVASEFFSKLYEIRKSICEKEEVKVLGLPLPYYEANTSRCATLYFGFTPPRGVTVGRYINIPNPNLELIVQEAENIPPYRPGKYMAYTQYLSQKGNKIQVFGSNPVDCNNFRLYLEQFTLYQESDVYFRAPTKEVQDRYNYELKLRRITYFPERRDRYSGNDLGEIIWEKRRPYDS